MGRNRPITRAEAGARLELALIPGVGAKRFSVIIEIFGSAAAALAAPPPELAARLGQRLGQSLGDRQARRERLAQARRVLARLGGRAIPLGAADYPGALMALPDPPPVIYIRGELSRSQVAIVGTRRASRQGCLLAGDMARELVRAGFGVISGGAYGIDAAAHLGALDAGGETTVVFGAGLDRPYPDRHIPLLERAALSGALVSPFRPGSTPRPGSFLARNALVAALGEAVVVVEAGWRSGARSTALTGLELGRPVCVVPGTPGCGRLLGEGAKAVESGAELLEVLRGEHAQASREPVDRTSSVFEALARQGPASADILAERLRVPVPDVLAVLMQLLLRGQVVQVPGGVFMSTQTKG